MTLEAALSQRIRTAPTLGPCLAEDDGWSMRLAGLPGITLMVVVDPRPQHFKGFQRVRRTSVQVDAWAETRAEAAAMRDALIALLAPPATIGAVTFQRAIVEAVRGGSQPEQLGERQRYRGQLARESIDFIFTHNAN